MAEHPLYETEENICMPQDNLTIKEEDLAGTGGNKAHDAGDNSFYAGPESDEEEDGPSQKFVQ